MRPNDEVAFGDIFTNGNIPHPFLLRLVAVFEEIDSIANKFTESLGNSFLRKVSMSPFSNFLSDKPYYEWQWQHEFYLGINKSTNGGETLSVVLTIRLSLLTPHTSKPYVAGFELTVRGEMLRNNKTILSLPTRTLGKINYHHAFAKDVWIVTEEELVTYSNQLIYETILFLGKKLFEAELFR